MTKDQFKQEFTITLIVAATLVIATLIYFALTLDFFPISVGGGEEDMGFPLHYVLLLIGLPQCAGGLFGFLMLSRPKGWDLMQAKPLADVAEKPESMTKYMERLRVLMIITFALVESFAIFGLVGYILGFPKTMMQMMILISFGILVGMMLHLLTLRSSVARIIEQNPDA
jgi:hypothetical protein